MPDKILLTIIAIFVLVFTAGIVSFFVIDEETPFNPANDTGITQEKPGSGSKDREKRYPQPLKAGFIQGSAFYEKTTCGTISGLVLNTSDRPVENALISLFKLIPAYPSPKLIPTHLTARSNENGRYTIASIPTGSKYAISVSADRYEDTEVKDIALIPDQETRLKDIILLK